MRSAYGDAHDDAAPTLEFAGLMIIAGAMITLIVIVASIWILAELI